MADFSASGNRSIVNLGSGIETSSSNGAQLMSNLSATNDGDGLHMDGPNGDLVWGNVLDNNGQYGLWLGGSLNADFSPDPAAIAPPFTSSFSIPCTSTGNVISTASPSVSPCAVTRRPMVAKSETAR